MLKLNTVSQEWILLHVCNSEHVADRHDQWDSTGREERGEPILISISLKIMIKFICCYYYIIYYNFHLSLTTD